MDVLVQFRQRVNESEIEFEKTVTITDDLTMGQLERHCLFLMGDWKYIRNGLISYSRNSKPDYSKDTLAIWLLSPGPVMFCYNKVDPNPINYTPINKYTFYDNEDQWVKVLIELDKVGELEKTKFKAEFERRTLAFKIHDYQGKDWIFRVPRQHFKISPEKCKFLVKPNKIIISLHKNDPKDNWFTQFKQKMVGEIPSDDEN